MHTVGWTRILFLQSLTETPVPPSPVLTCVTGRPRSDTVVRVSSKTYREVTFDHDLHYCPYSRWGVSTLSHLIQPHLCHYPVCESRRPTEINGWDVKLNLQIWRCLLKMWSLVLKICVERYSSVRIVHDLLGWQKSSECSGGYPGELILYMTWNWSFERVAWQLQLKAKLKAEHQILCQIWAFWTNITP